MNKKTILISFCLFFVFFSVLSSSSASDIAGNATLVGVDDNQNDLKAINTQQELLKVSSGTFSQLNDIVTNDSIPSGGVISLNSSYKYSDTDSGINGISIGKSITINGNGYTLDASSRSSIFNILGNSHVILKNLTFVNGYGDDGGAINVGAGSSIELIDCIFLNNTATNNGGAVFINSDSLTSDSLIKSSTFKDNTAANGGSIYVMSSTLNISASEFTDNIAKSCGGSLFVDGILHIIQTAFEGNRAYSGGAIYLNDTSKTNSTIENSKFNNCNATVDGGAVYISADNVHAKNLIFENNVAGDDGGAIYWEGNTGVIYNVTCRNNKGISIDKPDGTTSSTRGGSICLTGSNVILSDSKFTSSSAYMDDNKNYSKVDGGALFITGNDVVVSGTTFDACNATNNGGAVYVIGNNTSIINCDFKDCIGRDAGALYISGINCNLSNSTFTDNVAYDDGGAIYWEGDYGYMYNLTCVNNKGVSGYDPLEGEYSNSKGGTICLTGSNVTLDISSFTQSSAKADGGALFITGSDVKVMHSDFDDCISTDNHGGAIYIIGNRTSVSSCTFDNCHVNNQDVDNHRGGAIFVEGNSAHISDSSFTHTHALIGGAISIEGDDTIVDNSIFSNNNAIGPLGGSGGTINVQGAGTTVSNSKFLQGTAVNYGGALSIWGPNTTIVNSTFDQSKTTLYNGGAVFVNGENTTISNSNFTKCTSLGDQYARGGAIDVQGENANIKDCNFDDCDSHFGGVIHVSGTDAFIGNSNFKGSDAYSGGAIFVEGNNTVISKSNFTDSVATNYGGTIYVSGANANISECNFNKTVVKNYNGGAIYIEGENTNIEKSNFTSAEALNKNNHGWGGAIYIQGVNAVIDESNFNDCKAFEGGGAIYSYGNGARIEDSTFNSSTAKYGGAIYLTSWGALVTRSNISNCVADQNGGGIYVAEGSIQISESNFDECTVKGTGASNGGGAIYINGLDTHISASNFTHNTVPSAARGGSIFIKGERTIIEGSEFVRGSANNGGEIYIEGANAIVDTSTFINGSSRVSGGSIYIKGDEATVRSSSFDNISSVNNGGAIFVDGKQTDILSSSFYNCTVGSRFNGGAIYIDDIGTTVAYSNFTQSRANEGGAIYIRGVNTTITYCNLDHNVANSAGAIKVFGDDTILSNCNFTYNHVTSSTGGALDIGGANVSVYYSWFDHNEAITEGGAINWLGGHGDDSIIGSTFTNNVANGASRGGGAIYWTQGIPIASGGLIKDCIFINNTAAAKHGGAIDWYQALDSLIENCLFINNTANSDGGALYTGDQGGNSVNLTIIYCQFYNNTAGKYGGAIANQMANSYIFNNTFDGNKARSGGGTILMKEGPANNCVIDHCYIFNSHVEDFDAGYGEGGGAILLGVKGDSNITISNCAILNSTIVKGPGGAIAILGKDCSLINVSIQDVSTQNDDGGAIYWKGTNGKLDNVTIFNASSNSINGLKSSNGGAIHISGWYATLNDIKIFQSSANNDENCTKTNYGGALYVGANGVVATNIVIDNSTSSNVKMNGAGGAIYWDSMNGQLTNASISNTFASGNGGAIYWKGGSPIINNVSITYSKTEVTGSPNSADGGAIYSTAIGELNNVYINGASVHKDNGDVRGGAIYLRDGRTLNNVTVVGSRASSDNGTSYGGAIFFEKDRGSTNVWLYNSTFDENNADLGGGIYFNKVCGRIYGTSFNGNVANRDGGALYTIGEDGYIYDSSFAHNSAKNGGAIFAQNVHLQILNSIMEFNTAEQKGGAIYYNYVNKAGSSIIKDTDIVNNTAFQGSAIYATKLNKFTLENDVLLDNQANSNKFIEKAVGVDADGKNYTSAVFIGFDNLLNAIWQENTATALTCTNVTYWGEDGKSVMNGVPHQSDREVNINVTIEMYNERGEQLTTVPLTTDKNGKVKYIFDAEDGKTYYFAYVHKSDRYYTYLRDTLSNSSLVIIYVYTPIYYSQNQTVFIELTDGAWGNLNGTVTVTFNDTAHTTFTVDVLNGTGYKYNITDLPIGKYNATASYAGDINHTGDTDWVLFEVLPYNDLEITKTVDVTADYVNVTDVITYSITVRNHGPSKAYGVNVTERLSPYLKMQKAKATIGEYNLTGGYWYIGELDANDFETLTITAEVIHMGPITNTVWVTGLGKDINETNNIDSAHNFTALSIVDLSITKAVNVTKDIINVLDVIQFDIVVYNDGPCNATGVIVEELIDAHLEVLSNTTTHGKYEAGTWNIGDLENGSSATLTIVAKVIYSGVISNKVHVSGFENETDYTNNDAEIKNMTAIANVDLKITKDVNVSGVVAVTDKIKFTITVTNNGPCNATGVYVGETLSPHLKMISNKTTAGEYKDGTWVIGNLNNGEVHNLTIIAEVISAGTISNAVAIIGNDNDTNRSNNNDSIENLTAIDIVDLEINKTVDVTTGFVNVTDKIVFTIDLRNKGPCDATNVNVTELLSPHLNMIHYYTWGSSYDEKTGIWYIGNLSKNDYRQLVIVAQVVSAGTISNVVVVTSNENDTNTSNNKDEIDNITALPIVDLQITKKSNFTGSVINVTDYIKYTITVFNAGPCNATNVEVSERLPNQLKLINVTGNGYYDVNKGIWYIGNLNNQSTAVLNITAQVVRDGVFSNVVVVNSTENDTNPYNNRDQTDGITAVYVVDLQITKEVNTDKTEIDITESIVFTIKVYNAGPCNATGVYVAEPLSNILISQGDIKTPGTTYDGYTWYIGNLTSGSEAILMIIAKPAYTGIIENAVNVTGNEIDTNLSNNKDNITPIRVDAHIDVGINKTVNVTTGVVNVGDLVEFTITAYNNGPSNASGVYALEDLDPHLELYSYVATNGTTYVGNTWNIGNLNADATATLNITARVIKAGNFSNYVKIVGYGNDNNLSNNNYTIPNITAISVVDLEIAKEVNVTTNIVEFGDIIKFTITVRNNGPCDAHNVNVTEVLSPHLKLTKNETENGYYSLTDGIWYIGVLNNQSTAVLNITAQVISVGTISNFVNVTSRENDTNKSNNNDTIPDITAIPIVDLQITKGVNITSDVIYVLDEIKYTITVYNAGPCNATNVNVSEILSSHLKLIKNETNAGYYNVTEGIWYIGDLTNKSTAVLNITAKVVSDGIISNVVIVNSTEKDTNLSNNKDEISNITAVLLFDLQINKTVNVSTVDVGVNETIMFNITVYNAGPCNATDVYVYETLSDKLALNRSVASMGKWDGNIWYIGDLENGSSATLTIVARIAYSGIIENVVNVTGNGTDTNLTNNKDNITPLNATTHVDLAINKTVNVTIGFVNVTDLVKFTIIARNIGNFNATGVYVLEELDSHLEDYTYNATSGTYDGHKWDIGYLNAGATATLNITARVIKAGNFTNYVVIKGNDIDNNESNNNDTIPNITALPIVDLEIAKEVNVTNNTVFYGDTIRFTITVRNNGPCDATGVNVTEVLSPHINLIKNETTVGKYDGSVWDIGNLAKGQVAYLTILANVTSVGNITNVVNVTSTENDTNKSNNNASIPNITAKPIVDLRINKTVNVSSTDLDVTDVIKFTVTVVNDGPCNATNVYVKEVLDSALRLVIWNATKYDSFGYDNYTWVIGNMAVGENATLTIVAKIVYSGVIENEVYVTSNDTDINKTNNYDNITPITATTRVDLGINKTSNVTCIVNVSDLVKFTITVYNNGPCNASGVYVLEALDSHLVEYSHVATSGTTYDGYTWYIGYLNSGATATLNITARVVEAGNFSNYVEVFGYDEDTNTSNNNKTLPNITALPIVDLDIAKEVNVANVTYVGDSIVFTITVRNNGPCDATDVNVTEVLSSHLKMVEYSTWDSYYDVTEGVWHIGTLNKYDWRQLIIVTEVVSVGNISNVVSVNSTENDTNKSNNNASIPEIEVLPAVDLQIMKDVNVTSGYVEVYDFIEYTITVYNNGPSNATNVKVSEVLSSYLKCIRNYTEFGHYNVTEGIWYIGNLTVGSSANLTIVALVMRNGTVIPNVVTVNSTEKDTNPYNNRDEVIIAALPVTDLRITKEVNVTGEIGVTDFIKFVVTVYNDGPCDATGIYVTESLSDKLKLVNNITSVGEWDGYTWNIPKLANGTNATLTIIAQVVYPGNISNDVVVHGYQNETNDTNNNASIDNITAINNADLEISKMVNVSSAVVGDLIRFTVVVRNNGPCDATGVYVGEVLDSHLKLVSNSTDVGSYDGSSWVIGNLTNQSSAVLVIKALVVSEGNISNVVVVKGIENDTNTSNNVANITNITALNIVDLEITKVVNVSSVVNVSDLIEFTIKVTNNGPCDATGVFVSEVLNSNLRLVSNKPSVGSYDGATWNIGNLTNQSSATLIIVAEVISAGNITNTVNVTSYENDTNKSNNEANITNITSLPVVDLRINKTVNVLNANVNDYIEYTINVVNAGPSKATGVNVTEHLSPLLKFVDSRTWIGNYDNLTNVWNIPELEVNVPVSLVLTVQVIANGTIENVVSITANENDTNKSNNNYTSENVTALPIVDIMVNKTVNMTLVNVSDLVEFTIIVKNNGPSNASDVGIVDKLDSKLKFVSFDSSRPGIIYNDSTGKAIIGNLNAGETVVLNIVARVLAMGEIPNTVNATSRENDTNVSNNHGDSENITALAVVDLGINKTVNVTVVNVTDLVEYTITVRNNGPSNATGVNVFDKLDLKLEFVSFASSRPGITYDSNSGIALVGNLDVNETVILTITAKVIEMGEISNAVNVTSAENDTNKSNNNGSSDNVTSLPIVDLQINKTVSVNAVKIGEEFTYYITVVNNGPSTATNVNVLENLSEYLTLIENTASKGNYDLKNSIWHIGNLTKDESATLKLVVKAVSNVTIVNVVYVTGSENDTNLTNNNCTSDNVTVNRLDTPISINTYDITYGDDEILVVTLPDGATGTVNITVGNYSFTDFPIENGKVILPVSDLAGGNYTARVDYGGDNVYLPNSTSGTFNVARIVPIITIEVEDIWAGEIEVVNVTVNAPGVVYVTVYNRTVEISLDNGVVTTDILAASKNSYSGNATWNILNLPVGAYPAFALYPGNENYTSVNISDLFHVRDKNSTVVVTADDIYVGEDAVIYIKVGPEGVSGNVTVTVDGKKYILPIDENGKATLVVSGLKAGKKLVTVEYNGTILYRPSENSTTFNVLKLKPTIDVFAPEITVGDDGVITVIVPKDATGTITIEIEGRRYSAPIENGKAVFIVPGLKVGKHLIKVYYSGDGKYLSANTTGLIKVKPLKENKTDNKTTTSTKYSHGGVSLDQYPTGNPIWMIVCVLLSICTIQLRRFKK
ncbi:Ig-like domain repeat protein [uncultured Methanobrevibacter sp.]|uniref:Ig-like domain repeat protein n=1 Tax=uncultured Methanobrevibacter sp. TaxID=253161 RepID=UPI0025D1630A|nr:Ig-like domain repeat protein [uncultured Methanobrevibacter sp.]